MDDCLRVYKCPPEKTLHLSRNPMPELSRGTQRRRHILQNILRREHGNPFDGKPKQELARSSVDPSVNLLQLDPIRWDEWRDKVNGPFPEDRILELKSYYNVRFAKSIDKINWTFGRNVLTISPHPQIRARVLFMRMNLLSKDWVERWNTWFMTWHLRCERISQLVVPSTSILPRRETLEENAPNKNRMMLQYQYNEMDKSLVQLYNLMLQLVMEVKYSAQYDESSGEEEEYDIQKGSLWVRSQPMSAWERYRLSEPFLDFNDEVYLKYQQELDLQRRDEWKIWACPFTKAKNNQGLKTGSWDVLNKARYWTEEHPKYHHEGPQQNTEVWNGDYPKQILTLCDVYKRPIYRKSYQDQIYNSNLYDTSSVVVDQSSTFEVLVSRAEMHFSEKISKWLDAVQPGPPSHDLDTIVTPTCMDIEEKNTWKPANELLSLPETSNQLAKTASGPTLPMSYSQILRLGLKSNETTNETTSGQHFRD